MGAMANKEVTTTIPGAKLNKNLSALSGVNHSLNNNFKVSATICKEPLGPTRFGPKRISIKAATFRSMYPKKKHNTTRNANKQMPVITISVICNASSFAITFFNISCKNVANDEKLYDSNSFNFFLVYSS